MWLTEREKFVPPPSVLSVPSVFISSTVKWQVLGNDVQIDKWTMTSAVFFAAADVVVVCKVL